MCYQITENAKASRNELKVVSSMGEDKEGAQLLADLLNNRSSLIRHQEWHMVLEAKSSYYVVSDRITSLMDRIQKRSAGKTKSLTEEQRKFLLAVVSLVQYSDRGSLALKRNKQSFNSSILHASVEIYHLTWASMRVP